MSITIAVAGKGGTGKTTISGLIVRYLIKNQLTPILAIDADSNVNLNDVLGIEISATIGSIREEVRENIDSLPAGVPKEDYLQFKIQEILVEAKEFDLLSMGRPEGTGCYCYVNSILRRYIDTLSENYRFVVIDNEAGMEHLSRRTTRDVDYLFIISDPSPRGIETAARIRKLVDELKLRVSHTGFIVNRVPEGRLKPVLEELIAKKDLKLLGVVPTDKVIEEHDIAHKSVLELPGDSIAAKAIDEMLNRLLATGEKGSSSK